ncbi:MAG: hypothetical protein KKE51_07860 [Gammaproteobacteria bacterium]|nr:hypothetical protein [Gammaproteobacteria bacterium]MBU1602305.1 hypothetical protein [Gammaproteobacteria bacterium]MBU2433111.1 hypothetical protein [Gammaproteobacteria bacterium]MBU2451025.1 hypothetical protein [Gammaproteobacteria bacterium]
MNQRFFKLASAAIIGWTALTAQAAGLPGPIVTTEWLAANLDKVQIVDVRSNVKSMTSAPEFDTDAKSGKKTLSEVGGHIAGSLLLNAKTMRVERQVGDLKVKYLIPEKAAWEKIAQADGIEAGKPIVLVPVGMEVADVDDALRAYWQFKVYGEDNIAVLDGGMAAWLSEGRAFDQTAQAAKTGNWMALSDRSANYLAGSDDVAKAITDKSASLVDARDIKSFLGLGKRDYVSAYGHLPQAQNFPPELMTKSASGALKFMSTNTYTALLQAQGVNPEKPVISYCNSGHLAAGPWFITSEVLGKPARLYDGSLHQWTLEKHALEGAVPLN